jgi:hypothetical protein
VIGVGTLGLMSGDGKRSVGLRPQATAPILDSTDNARISSWYGNTAMDGLYGKAGVNVRHNFGAGSPIGAAAT